MPRALHSVAAVARLNAGGSFGTRPGSIFQILEEGHVPKQHLLQNLSIGDWTSQQVARWLVGVHLEHHIPEFTARNINGERLLQLDGPELKVTSGSPEFLDSFT